MSHEFINEEVDIYQLPAINERHTARADIQITIGDLHGNAMKLMFMLVKHGIATNIDDANYNRLVVLYKTPVAELNQGHLDEFNKLLFGITFRSDCLIRLIGDELADRGSNDYFTLRILEQLYMYQVPVEILVSNHNIEFIEASELQNHFFPPRLNSFAKSMTNLEILLIQGLISRDEIRNLTTNCYKPSLRIISYSLSEDKKNITIYSHAGIGLNTIKNFARSLNIEYNDSTITALTQTIDKLNNLFQYHVRQNTVHTLYTSENMSRCLGGNNDLSHAPFEFIIWNRRYDVIYRPADYYDFKVHFVHGHDQKTFGEHHVYNLDNMLGKTADRNKGKYTVLYSQEHKMTPIITPTEIEPIYLTLPAEQHAPLTLKQDASFLSQLEQIQIKEMELRKKGHITAADVAKDLYSTIKNKYEQLAKHEIDSQTFKHDCTTAINKTRPELDKHRGWKKILGNLALAIIGMGVFFVVAGLINKKTTGHFLFFKTDSAKKLDQLEQTVNSVIEP